MKLDTDKIFRLIKTNERSLTDFAGKIGMSHFGLKHALSQSTLKLEKLILIAEHFNKPIEYFFTDRDEQDIIDIGLGDDGGFTKFTDPINNNRIEKIRTFNNLLLEIRDLYFTIKNLQEDKIELLKREFECQKTILKLKEEIKEIKNRQEKLF
jgi:lambda repressor-like predicted transcriptional regulator